MNPGLILIVYILSGVIKVTLNAWGIVYHRSSILWITMSRLNEMSSIFIRSVYTCDQPMVLYILVESIQLGEYMKLVSIMVLMIGVLCSWAGDLVRVSTDTRTYCAYSTDDDGTYDCEDAEVFPSLFEFSGGNLFVHTVQDIQSTYYIKRQSVDTDDRLILSVVSDVGNEYMYAIGTDYIMAQKGSGYGSYIIKFHVKSTF